MTLTAAILLFSRDSRDDFAKLSWPLWRRVKFLRSSGSREGIARIRDSDIRAAYFMIMDASRDDIIAALKTLNIDTSEM